MLKKQISRPSNSVPFAVSYALLPVRIAARNGLTACTGGEAASGGTEEVSPRTTFATWAPMTVHARLDVRSSILVCDIFRGRNRACTFVTRDTV